MYGSLTTFNVLFKTPTHYFVGDKQNSFRIKQFFLKIILCKFMVYPKLNKHEKNNTLNHSIYYCNYWL